MSKEKRKTSLPVIRRRLFKLASIVCRENAKYTCEICGMKKGDLYNNKPQRVECHHVMSRSNKNSPLQYDLHNLICLCTNCHKTGRRSAHKHGLWFAKKFMEIRPSDAEWILAHTDDVINLDDREILKYIEDCLLNKKEFNFQQNK